MGFLKWVSGKVRAEVPTRSSRDLANRRSIPAALRHPEAGVEYDSFVELTDGYTHYELTGHEDDPLVVLVHGLTTPQFVWDYQMTALRRSGFRVLRYDLYGRGLSDRPRLRYDAAIFHRQLRELLESVGDQTPHALVGLSLGGAISVGATARNLVRPDRLFLIAPAGLPDRMPWWFYLAVLPGMIDLVEYALGEWYWSRVGPRNLSTDPEKRERARREMRTQLKFGGFHRALLSTIRYGPVYGQREYYRRLSEGSLPIRALWSREDSVVSPRMANVLERLIPRAEVSTVRGGCHTVNYDRPELVNPTLLDFLNR
jgi:pimeloyl-ACP methyl ester carboxylesterase